MNVEHHLHDLRDKQFDAIAVVLFDIRRHVSISGREPTLAPAQDARSGRARVEISIDQVRDLQHAASLGPYEGKCLVFIIDGEGQIHFSIIAKAGEPSTGVITGGTGRFRRSTGEITSMPLAGGAVRHIIQFNQNSS